MYTAKRPNSPIVVVFPEGGWHEQGMSGAEAAGEALRNEGFCAIVVRMAVDSGEDPEQPPAFPRQIEQAEAAIEWARENGATYQGDTSRLLLCGGSAGGHVAVMTGIKMNAAKGAGFIRGVASCGGLYDLKTLIHQAVKPQEEFNVLSLHLAFNRTVKELEEYDAGTLAEPKKAQVTTFAELWSPQDHLSSATCPKLYLARSETEGNIIPTAQHDAMVTAVNAAGVTLTSRIVVSPESGFKGHAFAYFGAVKKELAAFLLAA